jgi:hypothetical protein
VTNQERAHAAADMAALLEDCCGEVNVCGHGHRRGFEAAARLQKISDALADETSAVRIGAVS